MDKIKNSLLRVGNFTSSEIHRLMSTRKGVADEYITEKNWERKLQRSLSDESNARPLTWGKLGEQMVFKLLSTDYIDGFNITLQHPTIKCWSGSPDAIKQDEGGTVAEIKCPLTLKSFCTISDCDTIEQVRENHKDGDKFFYQMISNAILTSSKFAELICFCPYQHQLAEIRELSSDVDGFTQNAFAWINFASDDELPYIIEGLHYKNLKVIRFEVLQSDKDALTEVVESAGKKLISKVEMEAAL